MNREFREVLIHQARAGRQLEELVQSDLPALSWHVSDYMGHGGRGSLRGVLEAAWLEPDAEVAGTLVRDAMDRWARFLGSDPVEEPGVDEKRIGVRSEWAGLEVVIEGPPVSQGAHPLATNG